MITPGTIIEIGGVRYECVGLDAAGNAQCLPLTGSGLVTSMTSAAGIAGLEQAPPGMTPSAEIEARMSTAFFKLQTARERFSLIFAPGGLLATKEHYDMALAALNADGTNIETGHRVFGAERAVIRAAFERGLSLALTTMANVANEGILVASDGMEECARAAVLGLSVQDAGFRLELGQAINSALSKIYSELEGLRAIREMLDNSVRDSLARYNATRRDLIAQAAELLNEVKQGVAEVGKELAKYIRDHLPELSLAVGGVGILLAVVVAALAFGRR